MISKSGKQIPTSKSGKLMVRRKRCPYCNQLKSDVTFDACPYASDVHDDKTPVWKCGDCRHEALRDI